MTHEQLLRKLDAGWHEFTSSYAGLSHAELLVPGVTGAWSIRDVIAHVTTWEEEALQHVPAVLAGRTPPRYSVLYGGINAFNAAMAARKADLPLDEVLRQQAAIHRRVVDLIARLPEDQLTRETRVRRRLRLDTYQHYAKHAAAIRRWRGLTP